jgi:asparagine synthase (glutamine-hydrolysing)
MIYHQDEPIADWVCVPLHYVAKLARESGTIVCQVGEGSDELFHGYDGYISAARFRRRFWEPFQRVPAPLRRGTGRAVTGLARTVGRGEVHALQVAEAAAGRLPFWGGAICYQGVIKDRVLAPNGRVVPDSYEVVRRFWDAAERERPGADLLQKMTYLELKQRLAELLLMRVDKMTMATSVEARVPFLDHELVEFAMALPPEMKVRDGVGKYLLKKAVAGRLLPDHIVYRKKQGFGAPVSEWFQGELGRRAQRQIKESALAERRLIDYEEVDRMWEAHRRGPVNWAFHLWNLYNVSAWYDYWVAGRSNL